MILWAFDADGTIELVEGRGLEALGLRAGAARRAEPVRAIYADDPQSLELTRRALAARS